VANKLYTTAIAAMHLAGAAVSAAGEPAVVPFFSGGQTGLERQIPSGTTAAILQARMAEAALPPGALANPSSPFDQVAPGLADTSGNNTPSVKPPLKLPPAAAPAPKPSVLDRPGMTFIAPLQ
jgi:hypothetical protein